MVLVEGLYPLTDFLALTDMPSRHELRGVHKAPCPPACCLPPGARNIPGARRFYYA